MSVQGKGRGREEGEGKGEGEGEGEGEERGKGDQGGISLSSKDVRTVLPYFFDQTPRRLFISSRDLLRRLIEGGVY